MTRDSLEQHQVWFYLGAVVVGLIVGSVWPGLASAAETLVWPLLALLLFATFTQVPLRTLPKAFTDGRFLASALIGNFILIPLMVWGLIQFTPADDALRLGLLLVLLVPCTDWFITFTQLGRGDATRATAFAPLSLLVQLLLLPLYLWLLADVEFTSVFALGDVWPALLVVLVPLGAAGLSEVRGRRHPGHERVRESLGWWPVPLLSAVILCVAVAHVGPAREAMHLLPVVAGVALAFLGIALVLAKLVASAAKLSTSASRTLAFTFGTRNSFIVLPFALSLPAGWEMVAVVVVMQSLVELFGMIFYLWFVPHVLFRRHEGIAA